MADNIMDVGPVDMNVGYGNADAAGFYGLQKELLRRAALGRQAQLDEQARQQHLLDAETKRENIATLKERRHAAAMKSAAETADLQSKAFAGTHEIGAPLSADEQGVALRLFGQGGVTPGSPAQEAVPASGPVSPEDVAAGIDTLGLNQQEAKAAEPATFAGSHMQRTDAEHTKMAKAILNGDYDTGNESLDQFHKAQTLQFLSTGKEGAVPAGVIVPKTATEKDATRYFNTRAAQKQNKPVSADDAAFADVYEKLHPTEATKQNDALQRINVTVTAANTRQERGFANSAAEETYKELQKSYGDLNIPKITKLLETLDSPGGVADVVAVPEFLSSLAGGQGAGLRMSQAELNMIQNARPLLDSLIIKAGNIVGMNKQGYAALTDPQRAQMKALIQKVAQDNYALGQTYIDAQDRVNAAKDATEVRNIRSDIKRKELDIFGTKAGVEKKAGAKGFDADAARKKYGY